MPNPTQTFGPTQSARIRSLTIVACRILARQFGERVQSRLPFDLHSLLPVPVPAEIPFHELTGPKAIAWLQQHWCLSDAPSKVELRFQATVGKRLLAGHAVLCFGFFIGGATQRSAMAKIAAAWRDPRLVMQPRPVD